MGLKKSGCSLDLSKVCQSWSTHIQTTAGLKVESKCHTYVNINNNNNNNTTNNNNTNNNINNTSMYLILFDYIDTYIELNELHELPFLGSSMHIKLRCQPNSRACCHLDMM